MRSPTFGSCQRYSTYLDRQVHDALESSVVYFGTRLVQHIRAMEEFGADSIDC